VHPEQSIDQYLENFDEGNYSSLDVTTQIRAGWFDWFCRDSSLRSRTYRLTKKLVSLLPSPKIDTKNSYMFFKNNCPLVGSLYDDFRISDLKTGDVIWTIVPRSSHSGKAEVWGKENDFDGPIITGNWNDVKKFFREK